MTAEVIDGQLDLLELLGDPNETPSSDAPATRGPGARVLFHVRIEVVREDGTRYLTSAQRCGLCGSSSLSSIGSGSYCGADKATGDHWSLSYCGRCQERHLRNRDVARLIREGVIDLEVHEVPDGCDTCARRAHGDGISCGTHRVGAMYEHHVCSACGRRFKGHNGSADGRGVIGYGPVEGKYCSGPCLTPASELVRARYAELTNTKQED